MEMCNQKQQNILVTELGQDAMCLIMEIIVMRISNDQEGATGAEETCIGACLGVGPKAVIAVA